jgi:hypothetical protein
MLNPIYTPGAEDILLGSVTLSLTAFAVSPCEVTANDNLVLTIQKSPTATAGTDATICEGGIYQLSGTAENFVSFGWTTSGTGTFSSTTILNPIYTPGAEDILLGSVTLTLSASAISPCEAAATDNMILFIQNLPTVDAGADASICQGSTFQFSATAQNYVTIEWTTSGTGTFSSATILNPIYTPGAEDILLGTVTLALTVFAVSPCEVAANDNLVLTIQKSPTAAAGADATICEGSIYQLSGTAENYGTIEWTTSGTGTFSSTTMLNPIYTPGAEDILLGTVTLTLTSSAISPCEFDATDDMILSIQNLPTVDAGADASICEGSTFQFSATAQNYGTLEWTTSGTGTFSSATILNPIYTPGAEDILLGSVNLGLTAFAVSPCEVAANDNLVLTIQKSPTAAAGADATICEGGNYQLSGTAENYGTIGWITTGTGTFNSATILNPIYTPGAEDILQGTVTLILSSSAISPCEFDATDDMILFIQNLPTVDAGADASICQGSTFQFSATAQNYGTIEWTTSGTGTFSSATMLNPIYTPGAEDILLGSVNLGLTAFAVSPCEVAANDNLVLTIQKSPTAAAGADATICEGSIYQLSGAAENYGTIEWTTSGTGTFSSTTILDPIYTPGAEDILLGTVTLTLSASAISPCEVAATDNMILSIQNLPTVDAGADASICEGDSHNLSGIATIYSGVLWTTSGDGTFENPLNLATIYFPGTIDITNGTVDLTLSASAQLPCTGEVAETLTLTILPLPEVNFAPIGYFCQDSPPYQLTEGSPEGGIYSGPFVVDGWFYPADAGTGTFLLTYTYIDEFGCENSAGLEVDVQDCTSIDDTEEKSVSVMPNPGNGNFILQFSGISESKFQMKIYHSTGKLLLEQALPLNEKHNFALDLTSQPNGVYFLMLSNGDETMITKKLVISK